MVVFHVDGGKARVDEVGRADGKASWWRGFDVDGQRGGHVESCMWLNCCDEAQSQTPLAMLPYR